MSLTSSPFKQRDVTKVLKGAAAAGVEVERIEFCGDGKFVVWMKDEQNTESGAARIDKMLGIA